MVPATAAEQIARMFHGGNPGPEALQAAREHAMSFASPAQRARKYLALLRGEAATE
jgi:hypothetical protein